MKNKEEEMRLQLLNKQIIDEREEGLANKAGAESNQGGSLTHRLRIVLLCSLSTIGCEIYQL